MRGLRAAVFLTFTAAAIIACNALTGVSDLAVCSGSECAAIGLEGGSVTRPPTGEGGITPTKDGSAEGGGPCVDGPPHCEGRSLVSCTDAQPSRQDCPEACVGDKCVPWPSCRAAAGPLTCGGAGSCCETKPVPSGTFNRNDDTNLPASISAFSLDTYPVTVARFRTFIAAGGGTQSPPPAPGSGAHPKINGSGWQAAWNTQLPASTAALKSQLAGSAWTDTPGQDDERPISNVSWWVAFAFCAWDGGRLPTIAERSFAYVGGSDQRVQPWSSPPSDSTIDKQRAAYTCNFSDPPLTCPPPACTVGGAVPCVDADCAALGGVCQAPACFGCDFPSDLPPVHALTAGVARFGHFNLAGTVREWVLDARPRNLGQDFPKPCNDCALLMGPDPRSGTVTGADDFEAFSANAGWDDPAPAASTFTANKYDTRQRSLGFRCARDL